jgi:hypothetical protein
VAVNPLTGIVGVAYHRRNTFETYDTYLAQGFPGLGFLTSKVSTASSHPRDALYFTFGDLAPGCESCTGFIGDYIGLAYGRDGRANLSWTDMRDIDTVDGVTGYNEHIYFARR